MYFLVAIITAVILFKQLRDVQRANRGQAYLAIVQHSQNPSVRQARAVVFDLKEVNLQEWTAEERGAAETVCLTYDVVGMLAKRKLVDERMIIESWRDSIVRLWPILEPLINKYRAERGRDYWDDFAYLARRAREYHERFRE